MVLRGNKVSKKRQVRREIRRRACASAERQLACSRETAAGELIQRATAGSGSPENDERKRGNPSLVSSTEPQRRSTASGQQNTAGHAPIDRGQFGIRRKLGLRRGHPFEQIPVRDKQATEGPQNRVGHQPRLVCQECERQADLRCAERQIAEHAAKMASHGNTSSARIEPDKKWQQAGIAIVAENKARPYPGRSRRQQPPTTKVRNAAGADRVRRRLSSIFQRPMAGILTGFRFSRFRVAAPE